MSRQNDIRRDLFERAKGLSQLVDKVLFEIFPILNERHYKIDGSDNEKPLAFAIIDARLGKLDLLKMMRQHADQEQLRPPYPGLWRLIECENSQKQRKATQPDLSTAKAI